MSTTIIFHKKYFFAAVLLFVVEVCIAIFVQDKIIRPYVGDFLVVILLYTFLRSFFNISVQKAIFSVLLFSYTIEALQYLNLTALPGLENHKLVLVVLGSHFEWTDMIIYTFAGLCIYVAEIYLGNSEEPTGEDTAS